MRDCDRFGFELMLPKVAKNLDLVSRFSMYVYIYLVIVLLIYSFI